jgi:phage terminase large subunit-like protein
MLTASQLWDDVFEELGIVAPDPVDEPIPDPVDWIQANFYLYDTGTLMNLFEWQRKPLELALSRDPVTKNYNYNTVLWSWPKKSAKSSVIAAVADYVAEHKPNASVKLIANDLRQADSRVGYYLREAIKIGQRNGKRQGIVITPSGYKVTYPNGAKVESVPIDPAGEAGGNDDMMVYSELWGWKSKAQQLMWAEMTISPNKFGQSQRWVDTYAGYKGESPILEQLYETGVKQGRKLPESDMGGAEVYVNDAAKMLAVWVTKPMFKWQSSEYYASEEAQLVPSEFQRIHRNQWADAVNAFIPIEWWMACKSPYTLETNEPVIIGVDAATTSDTFAIVMVSRREEHTYVHYCHVWKPPKGGAIDYAEPEAELRRLIHTYNVLEVAFDSYQLISMMQRLRNEEFVNARAFSQGSDRLIADKRLYDMIRSRSVHHNGEPELTEHINNSAAEIDKNEGKLRIVKQQIDKKIDATIALSQANDRCFAYAF